jgi:hypothetical protein
VKHAAGVEGLPRARLVLQARFACTEFSILATSHVREQKGAGNEKKFEIANFVLIC